MTKTRSRTRTGELAEVGTQEAGLSNEASGVRNTYVHIRHQNLLLIIPSTHSFNSNSYTESSMHVAQTCLGCSLSSVHAS